MGKFNGKRRPRLRKNSSYGIYGSGISSVEQLFNLAIDREMSKKLATNIQNCRGTQRDIGYERFGAQSSCRAVSFAIYHMKNSSNCEKLATLAGI